MHAGSGNHGCEAIAYSTLKLLEEKGGLSDNKKAPVIVTNRTAEDERYALGRYSADKRIRLIEERHIAEHKLTHVMYYIYRKLTGDAESFYRYRYGDVISEGYCNSGGAAVSIGGDNYCYESALTGLSVRNYWLNKKGVKTILWGASLSEELMDANLVEDLNRYALIVARENNTLELLKKNRIWMPSGA